MPSKIPPKILTSIVRFQFYSMIDWRRCTGLTPNVLALELRTVIQYLIDNNATDLTDEQREELTSEILQEVHELGCDELTKLYVHLNPKVPLRTRLLTWTNEVLVQLGERKYHKSKPPSPA